MNDFLLIMDFMVKCGVKVEFGFIVVFLFGWMIYKEGFDVVVVFVKIFVVFKVSCLNLYFCF